MKSGIVQVRNRPGFKTLASNYGQGRRKTLIYILPFFIFIIGCSVFGDKNHLSSSFIKKWKEDSIACNTFRENNKIFVYNYLKSQSLQKLSEKKITNLLGKPNKIFSDTNDLCYMYMLDRSVQCNNCNSNYYAGRLLVIWFNKKMRVVSFETINVD